MLVYFYSQMKYAETTITQLENDKKRLTDVQMAILNEFLPLPIAQKVLNKREILPTYHEQMTVCVVSLLNFYSSTRKLPADEVSCSMLAFEKNRTYRFNQLSFR